MLTLIRVTWCAPAPPAHAAIVAVRSQIVIRCRIVVAWTAQSIESDKRAASTESFMPVTAVVNQVS
jgi:hypothetical protein